MAVLPAYVAQSTKLMRDSGSVREDGAGLRVSAVGRYGRRIHLRTSDPCQENPDTRKSNLWRRCPQW